MIFRNLDSSGDWLFGKGLQDFVNQNTAISLNIKTRLYSWFGDCFFAQTAGVDWTNRLGSKNQRGLLEVDLRRIILQSEGVTGITAFDTELIDRNFRASYTINTIYGQQYQDQLLIGI
jgi:hypothetical protein